MSLGLILFPSSVWLSPAHPLRLDLEPLLTLSQSSSPEVGTTGFQLWLGSPLGACLKCRSLESPQT